MGKLIENKVKALKNMNNEDENSVKVNDYDSKINKSLATSKTDKFVESITRVAIAQICETLGFQSFQNSALDTLSDISVRYLQDIGKIANSSANSANRRECNVFDVIHSIEDLNLGYGFPGCSNVHHCLLKSGMVNEIIRYVNKAEEIPFAYAVPEFPVIKDRKLNPSFAQRGENPCKKHIPSWLPVFPDPETYSENEKQEIKLDESNQIDECVKKRSQLNINNLLSFNGSKRKLSIDPSNEHTVDNNLFLSLNKSEKEVFPSKFAKYQNLLAKEEVFGATFGGLKCKESNGRQKGSFVQFKLSRGRKISRKSMHVSNITSWFSKDSSKDEKKRKVENILNDHL